MKKKLFTMAMAIALIAVSIVGMSLAYFTDKKEATNTFTAGGVKIDLIEQQRNEAGTELEDFKQDQVLMPIVGSAQGEKDAFGQPVAANYVDKIVTFSDYDIIWNRPTIRISNGIDFSEIPLRGPKNDTAHSLQLIAVATMHPWHGFDRVIAGMANYYRTHTDTHDYKVYLNIVGFGVPELVDSYKKDVAKHQLEKYIIFHSALYGKELDAVFEQSDMGLGSLARHRSGIDKIKTLKNREYAARGIPFVYSETDDDFEHQPYILKAAPDDSPLDIEKVIRFYQSLKTTPLQIRMSIEQSLSWKAQMQIVINETFE